MKRSLAHPTGAQPAVAAGTTGPVSGTEPHSARRSLVLRWVHPEGLLPPLDLASPLITIGREPDNHVVVPQPATSRHHARIERRGRARAIFDLGSRNGVFVNGVRIEAAAPLLAGSVVRVGDVVGVAYDHVPGAPNAPRDLLGGLFGSSALAWPLELARRAARSPLAVLIQGETGTGKELVARAVHAESGRSGPFVALNCAALSETLLDAELFGHERGVFTGADRARSGFVRAAHGGTLFLDEIGELSPSAQAKLLRVLEQRSVTPVGGVTPIPVDFRLVGATHRDLPVLVASGRFRADLFARLEGAVVQLPALRERREDVAFLFRRLAEATLGRPCPRLSARFVERLCIYDWPRNVRELKQTAERLAALHPHEAEWRCHHIGGLLPGDRASGPPVAVESAPPSRARPARGGRDQLQTALTASAGNAAAAARNLGISKQTLYRWVTEAGIRLEQFRREPSK